MTENNEPLTLGFVQVWFDKHHQSEKKVQAVVRAGQAYRAHIGRKMQLLPVEPYGYAIIYTKDGDNDDDNIISHFFNGC